MLEADPATEVAHDVCRQCGAPLGDDQRYCLNCGLRRAEARVPFREILGDDGARASAAAGGAGADAAGADVAGAGAAAGQPPGGDRAAAGWAWPPSPPTVLAGLALAVLVLGVGILIGRSGRGTVLKASAPAITVNGGGATGASGVTAQAAFTSDWPSGKAGYAVQLQTLPKQGTLTSSVAAAKSSALAMGAPAVGALDSDLYPSLPGGQYVIYSGVYDTKAQATSALKPLKAKFPTATVIHISSKGSTTASAPIHLTKQQQAVDQQLNNLNKLPPAQREKQALKLPSTISTGGAPPPVDHAKPGGGAATQSIG